MTRSARRNTALSLCLLALSSMFFVTGCSLARVTPPTDLAQQPVKPPLKLEVTQAFLSEGQLHVKAILESLGEVEVKSVVISFRGLSEGVAKVEELRPLSEVTSAKTLAPGAKLAVWFKTPAQELTEYQVSGSWGREGQELLAKNLPSTPVSEPLSEPISLENLKVERTPISCATPPCDEELVLAAEIVNRSNRPITEPRLGFSLVWREEGGARGAPAAEASEEVLSLAGLTVAPGEKKPFKLRVGSAVPTMPGGTFEPQVRLLPLP